MSTPNDLAEIPSGLRALLEQLLVDARAALRGEAPSPEEARQRATRLGLVAALAQAELNALQRASVGLGRFLLGDLRAVLDALEPAADHPAAPAHRRVLEELERLVGAHLALVENGARGLEEARKVLSGQKKAPDAGGGDGGTVVVFPGRGRAT